MRRSVRSPARIARTSEGGSTLFPFLAVLLCTMGSLIVLLVVISHQSRARAAQEAAAKSAKLAGKLEDEVEMSRWRVEQLKQSRDKTAAQLTEIRLHLSHLEDHVRRLRDKQSALMDEWEKLKTFDASATTQQEAVAQQLASLKTKIAEAEGRIQTQRQRLREAQSAYAIVPYDGENGTTRRPIYVECRPDAVVLQPLGVEFIPSDFAEPIEPGNPLDAALRAVREYWVMHNGFDPDKGEPYPLILVRPNGEIAYNLVRAAIRSWGSEFGYELIEEDWELRFPPVESGLDRVVTRAIDEARRRQEALARAAPRVYRNGGPTEFTISPVRGGLVPLRGSGESIGVTPRDGGVPGGFGRGDGYRRGGSFGGSRRLDSGSRYADGSNENRGAGGSGGGPQAAYRDLDAVLGGGAGGGRGQGDGTNTPGSGSVRSPGGISAVPGGTDGGAYREGAYRDGAYRDGGYEGGNNSGGRYATGSETGNGGTQTQTSEGGEAFGPGEGPAGGKAGSESGSIAGSPDGSESGTSISGSGGSSCPAGAQPGNASMPSLSLGGDSSDNARASATPQQAESGFIAGRPPSDMESSQQGGQIAGPGEYVPSAMRNPSGAAGTPTQPSLADTHHRSRKKKAPLAESRGINWGLPGAGSGSIPITRPIRVECYKDQIVLRTERRNVASQSVPLGEETRDAIDSFVAEVWKRMDSWGIAGRGMYWRPILHVYHAPDAESRADDLEALLEGSGLEVKRK